MTPTSATDDRQWQRQATLTRAEQAVIRRALRRHDAGFTLLELLLVIAIMVAVLAIALPMTRGSFSEQRLRKAGETVQTEWAKARNRAIKTGQVHVFQHAIYSDQFITTVQASPEDTLLNATATSGQTNPALAGTLYDTSAPQFKKLPEGVFFLGADIRIDQRTSVELSSFEAAPIVQDVSSTVASQQATGEITWGMPVFFFPDGTTSTASLILGNDRQRTLTITLRGLTGVPRIGHVQSIDPMGAAGSSTQ